MINLLNAAQIEEVFNRFKVANPEPKTELKSKNPFTLLVSVVLSAQATDRSVNKATELLYQTVDSPAKMLQLGEEGLIGHIKTVGLYRSKARHIMELSAILAAEYGPESGAKNLAEASVPFPRTREEFECLPGVGRKTANVMLNVLYNEAVMPVDTHLLRISPRIGLSRATTPRGVEQDLLSVIPQKFLGEAHHHLVLHGRYVCTARKPQCSACLIEDICKKNL